MADELQLSEKQQLLLAALCELDGGTMLKPEARRIAGPLLSKGLVWWFGFGKVRVYQATDRGRAALASAQA